MKIISQETIKPSSPTPSHLKIHVLSLIDNYTPALPVPFVFFYKHYNDGDINILKKSLSQCLTQYYPFAGRFLSPTMSHIDCNDKGVDFLEVSQDGRLEDFILNDESLHELVPNVGENFTNLVGVQLNHFKGGTVAVGVSILHKIADGFAAATFVQQWANVTRGGSPFIPNFITSSISHMNNVKPPEAMPKSGHEVKYAQRTFVFPNSKLNELKKNVMSCMDIGVTSPPLTRVEVLTSLIFKCAVEAATTNSGFFQPLVLLHAVNMRNKVIKNNPEKTVGNILLGVAEKVKDSREIALNEIVAKLRKMKMETEDIRDVQEIGEKIGKMFGGDHGGLELFWTSSFCWFPFYEVDFGWGMPVKVKYVMPKLDNKNLVLMDTPHKDGIEAIVSLPEKELMIFQQNEELLSYVDV